MKHKGGKRALSVKIKLNALESRDEEGTLLKAHC